MSVRIIFESPEKLAEYASVPISFEVRSKLEVLDIGKGFSLIERPVEPYTKDYDSIESPTTWPQLFDLSSWKFLAAFDRSERIGGAVVAYRTEGLEMLDGRDDVACLWDIRVSREHRGRGIGTMLFDTVVEWARKEKLRSLKVETQDINVPASRFYAARGCELAVVNPDAYPLELCETQLIWHLDL